MNIALLLEMAADAEPTRIGLVCEGRQWTYKELLDCARAAVGVIEESKVQYVALLDESSEASVIALFGAAMAGIPYCPLNYRLPDTDLGALLDRIAPALVIGDPARLEELGSTQNHLVMSREAFVAATKVGDPAAEREYDRGEGVAVQLFTSGTTAAPKAAILRHSNLMGYILGSVEFCGADEGDCALIVVPPYHIAGISAVMSSIYAGRRMIMLPAFAPDAWLGLVADHKVTNAFLVPTMLQRIVAALEQGSNADISSLRAIAYGGGKMPLEVIQNALQLFPTTGFTNAYGLTETSSTIALLGPGEHRAALASDHPAVRARLTSIGKALPTVEIEIRDDEGRPLPPGERGEIYVRGDQVSGEYRERSALIEGGWFPTRDAGYMDEEGYIFISGRADDVIVRGGENLSPGEIEDVLLAHPGVAEAAAVGIPSVEWGEAVAVAIALRPGHAPSDQEIMAHVRDRLRSSRVPEQVLRVDGLPYNEMGKLLRRNVRALFS